MSTALLLLALLPIAIALTWHLTATLTASALPTPSTLHNKRIILLIAHPDDEAMFFAPTLQALTSPALGNHVKVLCLSTGDADGLGAIRSKELIESALLLGVKKREDVFVMDDARFRDGMQNEWKPEDVCRVLGMAFAPQIVSSAASSTAVASTTQSQAADKDKDKDRKDRRRPKHAHSKSNATSTTPSPSPTPTPPTEPQGPRATIDVLVTFDAQGISSHPNHIALHAGARLFLSSIMRGHAGWKCPVTLYTLPTVNMARKYSFVFDALTTLAAGALESVMGGGSSSRSGEGKTAKGDSEADAVLFVNDYSRYWAARNAMVRGHKSQMVWFRWGWISLGRYMVVNDLKRETVTGG